MGKEKMKGLWVCVKMILNQRAEVEIERQTSEKDVLLRYKRKKKKNLWTPFTMILPYFLSVTGHPPGVPRF